MYKWIMLWLMVVISTSIASAETRVNHNFVCKDVKTGINPDWSEGRVLASRCENHEVVCYITYTTKDFRPHSVASGGVGYGGGTGISCILKQGS